MWNNKHLTLAFLIAPLLALISYFAVDYFVSERPQAAQSGRSYQLVEKSNCRYASGLCDLKNGDMELTITIERDSSIEVLFNVRSEIPLNGISVALVEPKKNSELDSLNKQSGHFQEKASTVVYREVVGPLSMKPVANSKTMWQIKLPLPESSQRIRIAAAAAAGTYYYGETSTQFSLQSQP